MKAIRAFAKRHPLLSYFALAFAISWGGILIAVGVGPGGILATPEQYEALMPFLYLAMLLGPSVAGILLTGHLCGRAGFRELRSRLLKWRVGARWYAVALLTAPLVFTAVLLALSVTSSEFLPSIFVSDEKATLVLVGIVAGLVVGFFEELGWTGFATPTLLRRMRYGVLGTGLIVGSLWGVWHFLVNVLASDTTSGALSVDIYLPAMLFAILAWLTAYRVLMVWVYDRTNGSLLAAILMHLSLVASTVVILNPLAMGVALVTYNLVWAAALWMVVGAVAVAQGGHLSRAPLRRRVA
jgi:membrane protease YdiL (CAAX protease family)